MSGSIGSIHHILYFGRIITNDGEKNHYKSVSSISSDCSTSVTDVKDSGFKLLPIFMKVGSSYCLNI